MTARRNSGSVRKYRKRMRIKLFNEQGGRCGYCDQPTRLWLRISQNRKDEATIDHIVPLNRGGTDERGNLKMACLDCNNRKGDRTADEFRAELMQAELCP